MNTNNNNQSSNPTQTPQSSFKNQQYKGNKQGRGRFRYNKPKYGNKDRFHSESEHLKGKIYFIGSVKQSDNFNTTTEAILQYIQRSYDQGALVVQALRQGEEINFNQMMPVKIPLPEDATQEQRDVAAKILDCKIQKYVDAKEAYKNLKLKAYSTILRQYDKNVKAKLESRTD